MQPYRSFGTPEHIKLALSLVPPSSAWSALIGCGSPEPNIHPSIRYIVRFFLLAMPLTEFLALRAGALTLLFISLFHAIFIPPSSERGSGRVPTLLE